jgi:hypothetical protein
VEDGQPYFVFDENPPKIPVRVVKRHDEEDWQTITKEEWKRPFDMDNGPLARMVWIKSDEVSELLLVSHHCACDGASLVAIYKELLLLIDQPDLQVTPYPPFQSPLLEGGYEIISSIGRPLQSRRNYAILRHVRGFHAGIS